MNVVQSSPTIDDEFDAFLFAPIGDETNGMALSVLSALARLDIDPWADAARLSRLSKDSAIVALNQSLARLPIGKWQAADTMAIATRLVELLPQLDGQPAKAAGQSAESTDWRRRTTLVLALLSVGLIVYLLIGGVPGIEHRSGTSTGDVHVESSRTHP
jgi:hypothetical protein